MTLNFPPTQGEPTDGSFTYVYAGVTYSWDGVKWEALIETDAPDFDYTYPGGVERTIANRLQDFLSVKDFGAVGDGVTDDTAAIQAAVDAAELNVIKRHYGGCTVLFPSGAYLVTSTIIIQEESIPPGGGRNGITLQGEGATSSAIIANSPNFDLVSFVGKSSRSYYGGGVKGLSFVAPGNATANALLRMYRTIGSSIDDVQFDGGYENLTLDGCADLLISNLYCVDISRTSGIAHCFIRFKATEFVCSDVHLSNIQIKPTKFAPLYSIIINGSDGIYCTNGHQFGGLRYQPESIGISQSTSSTYWSNWYFDSSTSANIYFVGNASSSSKFNNHRFVSCDLRDGERGFVVDSNTGIKNIVIADSRIGGQQKDGIYTTSNEIQDIAITGCILNGNNLSDSSSASDVFIASKSTTVVGCIFKGGGASGAALRIGSSANHTVVGDCNFGNSNAGTKVIDDGDHTKISNLVGVTVSNSGTAVLSSGSKAVTVPHGCDLLPDISTVVVTPTTDAAGVTRWWADSRTATSFAIRTNADATDDVTFAWQISYKND